MALRVARRVVYDPKTGAPPDLPEMLPSMADWFTERFARARTESVLAELTLAEALSAFLRGAKRAKKLTRRKGSVRWHGFFRAKPGHNYPTMCNGCNTRHIQQEQPVHIATCPTIALYVRLGRPRCHLHQDCKDTPELGRECWLSRAVPS